jgi:sugar lactone lactonase YvrE
VVSWSVAVPAEARVGEGPFWDGASSTLVWVDILGRTIHRSDVATGATTTIALPWLVGAAVPRRHGGYVAATEDGFAEVDDDGTHRVTHAFLDAGHRMNDAGCDPAGRLWAGSVHHDFRPGHGALHVLRADGTTEVVLDDLTQPNGMAWTADGTVLYLVDTQESHVLAIDVDPATATALGSRVVVEFDAADGLPDGMCLDDDGLLWVAMWGAGQLLRCSTTGEVVERVPLPVEQPSSCAFGGPEARTLFVTSASEGLPRTPGAIDGSVLRVDGLGVGGPARPPFGT